MSGFDFQNQVSRHLKSDQNQNQVDFDFDLILNGVTLRTSNCFGGSEFFTTSHKLSQEWAIYLIDNRK